MPVEVYDQDFLINVDVPSEEAENDLIESDIGYNSEDEDNALRDRFAKGSDSKANNTDSKPNTIKPQYHSKARPPFRYTFLHDIESLLWIALWVILHHLPRGTELEEKDHLFVKQISYATKLFPSEPLMSKERRNVIVSHNVLKNKLEDCLRPPFSHAIVPLVNIRGIIHSHSYKYQGSLANDPNNIMTYNEDIYRNVRHNFRSITRNPELAINMQFVSSAIESQLQTLMSKEDPFTTGINSESSLKDNRS